MKPQKKPARSRAVRRQRHPVLTLTQRVERLERHPLLVQPPARTTAPVIDYSKAPRFTKLRDPKADAGEHIAVRDARTGLIWTAEPLAGGDRNWKDAIAAAADCRLLGESDWRLPTIQELLSIVDYERWDPAVDPEYFRGPYGWTWSSTPVKGAKAPAGCAWFVDLYYGFAGSYGQSNRGRVRAVRAGQQLALGVS